MLRLLNGMSGKLCDALQRFSRGTETDCPEPAWASIYHYMSLR